MPERLCEACADRLRLEDGWKRRPVNGCLRTVSQRTAGLSSPSASRESTAGTAG